MTQPATTLPAEEMSAAFPAAFERFGRTLRVGHPGVGTGAVPCPVLFCPGALAAACGTYAATLAPSGADRRATISLWSQYYLLALVPAVVAAALAAEHDLPVDASGMGAVLASSGLPDCLCLPHGGRRTAVSCPVSRLTPLLRGHLQPLAAALAGAGLPQRVFWSNAAQVLVWSLCTVSAPGAACGAVSHAATRPDWADGSPNPFAPALAGDGRSRRVCCLRYRLPGITLCPGCPRPAGASNPKAGRGPRAS